MDTPTRIKLLLISFLFLIYTSMQFVFVHFTQLPIKNVFLALAAGGIINSMPIWLTAIFPVRYSKVHRMLCYLSALFALYLFYLTGKVAAWFIESAFLQHKGIVFSPAGVVIGVALMATSLYAGYLFLKTANIYAKQKIT